MSLVLQKLKVALGIALCVVGLAGTIMPVVPGVPIILAGVALMGADHPLVVKVKNKLKHWRTNRASAEKE